MSDKEERILCSCYTGEPAKLLSENNLGMTRQEAIERIAKAICKLGHEGTCKNSCEKCDIREVDAQINRIFPQAERFLMSQAEAALNALLEGVKK